MGVTRAASSMTLPRPPPGAPPHCTPGPAGGGRRVALQTRACPDRTCRAPIPGRGRWPSCTCRGRALLGRIPGAGLQAPACSHPAVPAEARLHGQDFLPDGGQERVPLLTLHLTCYLKKK